MQTTKYKLFLVQKNIQQISVIRATGMMKSNLSMFANGYININMKTLKRLCQHHNCSPNEILDWEKWLEEAALAAEKRKLKLQPKK